MVESDFSFLNQSIPIQQIKNLSNSFLAVDLWIIAFQKWKSITHKSHCLYYYDSLRPLSRPLRRRYRSGSIYKQVSYSRVLLQRRWRSWSNKKYILIFEKCCSGGGSGRGAIKFEIFFKKSVALEEVIVWEQQKVWFILRKVLLKKKFFSRAIKLRILEREASVARAKEGPRLASLFTAANFFRQDTYVRLLPTS